MKKYFLFSPISLLCHPLNTALLCVCVSVVITTQAHSESSLIKGPESQIGTPSPSSTEHSSQSMQIKRLEARIVGLEKENAVIKNRLSKLENSRSARPAKELAEIIPEGEKEKRSFFEAFRREMKSDSVRASGPWTKPESWESIRRLMSSYQVRQTLGMPTRKMPSVKPSIEEVFLYIGDLDSDGVEERGVVNFKDKRVVSFESPYSN